MILWCTLRTLSPSLFSLPSLQPSHPIIATYLRFFTASKNTSRDVMASSSPISLAPPRSRSWMK
ncbi:hypothetical protein GmHk_05G014270 [Glycine max]|nr:hypothetical protein GmHk_05G014270 [Glycine max]